MRALEAWAHASSSVQGALFCLRRSRGEAALARPAELSRVDGMVGSPSTPIAALEIVLALGWHSRGLVVTRPGGRRGGEGGTNSASGLEAARRGARVVLEGRKPRRRRSLNSASANVSRSRPCGHPRGNWKLRRHRWGGGRPSSLGDGPPQAARLMLAGVYVVPRQMLGVADIGCGRTKFREVAMLGTLR